MTAAADRRTNETAEAAGRQDQGGGRLRSLTQRLLDVVAFVTGWVTLGYALPVSSELYLLPRR